MSEAGENMAKKTVRNLNVRGRRVLIRADLNVPLDKQTVTDDRRIRMFLPTLEYVLHGGGRAIVMSHLGRPVGDPAQDAKFSLQPVATRMGELLKKPVKFVPACVGPVAAKAVGELRDGEVLLLENVRFHTAETVIDQAKKNPDKQLTPGQDALRRNSPTGWWRMARCTSTTPLARATASTSACTTCRPSYQQAVA